MNTINSLFFTVIICIHYILAGTAGIFGIVSMHIVFGLLAFAILLMKSCKLDGNRKPLSTLVIFLLLGGLALLVTLKVLSETNSKETKH